MVVATLQVFLALLHLLVGILLFSVVTKHGFVNERMEELFFPAMIASAGGLHWTSFFILTNEVASLPLLANFKGTVGEQVRFPSEILPVMSVDTLRLVVLSVERTPLSFEVKNVELHVARHLVYQRSFDVLV